MQIKNKNILNCYTKKSNIIPLTRENSITYIRKKSLNMNVYNNVENNFASNTPSALKNKKNYSISSSCYNTKRNMNESKDKKNYAYSPRNNISEKNLIIPEYKIKLENIKSRINNLLNVYSLLALRSLNVPGGEHNINNNNLEQNDE